MNNREDGSITELGTLEAVLFAAGKPLSLTRLADAVGRTKQETEELLQKLSEKLEGKNRGLHLGEKDGTYYLSAQKQYYGTLIRIARQPKKPALTNVIMETLAIIAYKQPITRGDIDKIRGVGSSHAVKRLIDYGLVEELGRLDGPGRPVLLGTTARFLEYFGVESNGEILPAESADLGKPVDVTV